jgi:hypothetical protein
MVRAVHHLKLHFSADSRKTLLISVAAPFEDAAGLLLAPE